MRGILADNDAKVSWDLHSIWRPDVGASWRCPRANGRELRTLQTGADSSDAFGLRWCLS